jgi:anti-anti-sigma factor
VSFRIQLVTEGCYRFQGQLLAAEIDGAAAALESVAGDCTLDLDGLTYISSAGLRLLLRTQARLTERGHALRLVNPSDHLRDLFAVTGLDQVFDIDSA